VVAAAGNEASTTPVYPAAYPGVVGVGATDDGGHALTAYSNRGGWVDLAAPGAGILTTSTLEGGYASYDGTSFAAPFVAAAAGLVLAAHPAMSGTEVEARLRSGAARLGGVLWGRLDAGRSVVDPPGGYWVAGADGSVFVFGQAPFMGSQRGRPLAAPIVGMAGGRTGGYWLVASDGGVFAYGGAPFAGSTGGRRLSQPIVGMAATPSGRGYWLVAADGGIFAFGDALFLGSTGNLRLNAPVVGMAPTPTGRGYWLVAADGGVFTFGDATFRGAASGRRLGGSVVGIASAANGGYWIAAADGGVFSFGAPFHGSGVGVVDAPVASISAEGDAYRIVTTTGVVVNFGSAGYLGSVAGRLNQPVVAMAAAPPPPL
jgi:hypothetical protein